MSDRHRMMRRPHSAPIAPAFAGGLSWAALSLSLLIGSGCRSGADPTTQGAKPAKAQPTAVARVPSCEGDLAAIAQTLEGNRRGWTPGRGIVPDFSGYVAAALWKSCDLPEGARVLLAHAVTLPKPPWEVAGTPKPADAQDPAEVAMPGFGAARALGEQGRQSLAEFQRTVCPDRDAVFEKVASVPLAQKSAQIFEGCGLDGTAPLSPEAFIAAGLGPDGVGFVALYQWLLEAKIEADVAGALIGTLAVGRSARLAPGSEFAPPPALRLAPVAHGLPPREGTVVYVGPDAILLGDRRIAQLPGDGSLAALLQSGALSALEDDVATRMPPGGGTVLLALDRGLAWPVAAGVVATVAKAGAADIDALVLGPHLDEALRRVPMAQAGATGPHAISVLLDEATATVTCAEKTSNVAYTSVADAIATCPPEAYVEVTVSGSPKLRDVLDALDGLGERARTLGSASPSAATK